MRLAAVITILILSTATVQAENRASKCGGCGGVSHGHHDNSTFHQLKEELNHLGDPFGVGDLTIGDQYAGDLDNALDNGQISKGQWDKLNREYNSRMGISAEPSRDGNFSSQGDIGGIP